MRNAKVGERVKVYDALCVHKGKVLEIGPGGETLKVRYTAKDGTTWDYWFSGKQCRRLKPKPKPVKREPRVVYINEFKNGYCGPELGGGWYSSQASAKDAVERATLDFKRTVKFVEEIPE